MNVREKLLKIIEAMGEEDLQELFEYAKWLQSDKEGLSPEEPRELEEGKAGAAR